jgi:hypothetical protein
MDNPDSRFKKIDVKYSVTEESLQLDNTINDGLQPYTLIEWLKNAEIIIADADKYIESYNSYLRDWQTVTVNNVQASNITIRETYVALLKEIIINYSTLEEKRFFANIDYTNKTELDAVMPFFAKRIKEIILFITKKRDIIKYEKMRNSFNGTKDGIKRTLRDRIINLISGDDVDSFQGIPLPDVDSIVPNLRIEVNELYDLSEEYFDVYNFSDISKT